MPKFIKYIYVIYLLYYYLNKFPRHPNPLKSPFKDFQAFWEAIFIYWKESKSVITGVLQRSILRDIVRFIRLF